MIKHVSVGATHRIALNGGTQVHSGMCENFTADTISEYPIEPD